MSTAGLLRSDEVVFYHPLDNETEHTLSQVWSGSAGFVAGKVGSGKSGVTGTSITFASPATDGAGLLPQGLATVAKLTATKMCICYPIAADDPGARIVTISGTAVTFGAEHTFSGAWSDMRRVSSAALSSSTVVIAHSNSSTGHAFQLLTVSGTDITSSASVTDNTVTNYGQNVVAIDSTRAVAFMAGGSGGRICVLTASGGTLTKGALTTVSDGDRADGIAKLDSTRVVFNYRDGSGNGQARVATVSGTTVTIGAATQFDTSYSVSNAAGDGTNGGIASLGGGKFVVLYKRSNAGRLIVGAASGTDITFGANRQFIAWYGFGQVHALDSTKAVVIHKNMDASPLRSRAFVITVSGTDITEGAEVAFSVENGTIANGQINAMAVIDAANFFAFYTEFDLSERRGVVGSLSLSDASLTGGAGYPSTIGDTRVAVAMWAKNLTSGSSTVKAECGYSITMTATTIALGGTTATWNDAGIASLMSNMNDGSSHLLVLDFENSGTDWTLSTSVDGAAWVDQGIQNTGSQAVTTTDTLPAASLTSPATGQWIDELVMWSGDKLLFEQFTTQELANLNDLADVFGDTMDQFESNFAAPICWQATAKMPDGSVWRDSGSGPCPAVVRVPKGAEDIMVTDDGNKVSPRIVEG